MHKVADQQGRLALLATQLIQKDLDPGREMVPDSAASTPTAVASSPGSLSLSASDSSFLAHLPAAAAPAPAPPLLASALVSPQAQSAPAVLLQVPWYILQGSAAPGPVASSLNLLSRPLKANISFSVKKDSHIRL